MPINKESKSIYTVCIMSVFFEYFYVFIYPLKDVVAADDDFR